MDAVNKIKEISGAVMDVQVALVEKLAPSMREVLEQGEKFRALPEDQRVGDAKMQVATMILTMTIALMRQAGCTDGMIETAIANARAYEAKNAKSLSPS